jgi:hypothetical protein
MPSLRNDPKGNRIEGPAGENSRKLCKPTAIITNYDTFTNSDLYKFRFRDRVNLYQFRETDRQR